MEKLQLLQGAWRFIYEEAPLDDDTPIWVFRGTRVIEIGKRRREGRCGIVDGDFTVTFPGPDGPVVVTLYVAGDAAGAWVNGHYSEQLQGFELNSYCNLLRVARPGDEGEPVIEDAEPELPLTA